MYVFTVRTCKSPEKQGNAKLAAMQGKSGTVMNPGLVVLPLCA